MISKQAVSLFLNLRFLPGAVLMPFLVFALTSPLLAQVPQGWPAEPLEMTPRAGVLKFQDGKLFDNWPFFSEDHIVAGTTAVSKVDTSGNRLLAGSLIVAWQDGEVAHRARGAFVLKVSTSGERLGQAYFGAIPYGEQDSEYALDILKIAENSVTVGGWVRPSAAERKMAEGKKVAEKASKDTFQAELSSDLFTTYWTSTRPFVKVPNIAGESKAVAISIDLIDPIDPAPRVYKTHPNDVQIVNGFSVSCDASGFGLLDECVPKVAASDDDYALVFADFQAGEEGGDLATFRLNYPIPEKMPKLTGLQFEVTSDDCMTVRVSLGGGNAQQVTAIAPPQSALYSLPPISSCELGDQVISFDVPEDLARELGFWDSLPETDLIAQVDVEVFGEPCSNCLSGTAVGLDESTASSEVADP